MSLQVICAVLAALAVAACGDGSNGGATDLPPAAVAKVGDNTIAERELDTQVKTLKRAHSGGDAKPTDKQLEQQALAMLLQREWIEQEARKRGIRVSPADARQRWRAAAAKQFKTKKALRRFLGGQTEADVVSQIRIQMLNEAIEEDIRAKADGNPRKAVKRFREGFLTDLEDATTCRKGYNAPGCADS